MRLRQIEVFHAVYSSGSVTRAAKILNVSQPSVSKVLAHAEQQLGYKLFDRAGGKLTPTPEADRLFSHVTTVYDSVDRLRHVAENLRDAESGVVRVAANPAFGMQLLPAAVATYQRQHADTVFAIETLHHDEICDALREARLDIGLAFDPSAVAGIEEELLAHGDFVVLTPVDTNFGTKKSLTVGDLAKHPFIRLDSRGPLGRLLSTHIESSGVQLNTVAYTETYHMAKALVSQGAGITITDEITARSSGHENIRIWPLEPNLRFKVCALRVDTVPLSIIAKRFVEHLRSCVQEFLDNPS